MTAMISHVVPPSPPNTAQGISSSDSSIITAPHVVKESILYVIVASQIQYNNIPFMVERRMRNIIPIMASSKGGIGAMRLLGELLPPPPLPDFWKVMLYAP